MHRLLVSAETLESDQAVLPSDAAHHLKVVRPKLGETIELFDGVGRSRLYRCGASSTVPLAAAGDLVVAPPSAFQVTLFACVTKGSRWDWTIEKATELGVTRIVPVVSARTIVRIGADEREAKRARWIRIAEDAARQSDAKWIPEIHEPVSFAESLPLVRETTCFVGALTNPPPRPMVEAMRSSCGRLGDAPLPDFPRSFSVYVGPEGDFSPEELAALIEIATPVSFGSTILRAETAAIYGVSVLKSFLDAAYSNP